VDDGLEADLSCALAVNHGAYVPWVAHTTPPGPGHGAAVSAAAHSDCGKKGAVLPDTSGTADDEAAPLAGTASPQTKGHGNGKGHGYGQDKGTTGAAGAGHGKPDHAASGSTGHGHAYGQTKDKTKTKEHGPK